MSGKASQASGYRFEHRILSTLRENGYWATRTPASKTCVDIVAVKPGQTLFVQCKVNGRLDPDDWNALYDMRRFGGLPVLVERLPGYELGWHQLTGWKVPGQPVREKFIRQPFKIDQAAADAGLLKEAGY